MDMNWVEHIKGQQLHKLIFTACAVPGAAAPWASGHYRLKDRALGAGREGQSSPAEFFSLVFTQRK